ncbi:maleylpyruvate isomerase N-terminal domain-containing protein [Nocardioides sp. TF02-7]|uniref:maleylpyruvate isomerase N-terminal domain-containing protein n=1 Tax=Nocardioides sp. TF02-7 TaxID=2917724 RepID=UPI001F0554E8|nr:maleylpyruvate isomerase N-terminal domain-containing protein [Nocardioides sp. TF02-7]UMG91705.1 hypothetical protein MF408_16720 [Nocardioides sp. TF02-7]
MSTSTQSETLPVLVRALDQAGDVLDHVHADRLGDPTPCSDWDVGRLADHLVDSPVAFLTMVRGDRPDWDAPPPHVTESWGAAFRVHADDLVHAWHELTEDPPVPAAMIVSELAIHTWDLATAIGFPGRAPRPGGRRDGAGVHARQPEAGAARRGVRRRAGGAGGCRQLRAARRLRRPQRPNPLTR